MTTLAAFFLDDDGFLILLGLALLGFLILVPIMLIVIAARLGALLDTSRGLGRIEPLLRRIADGLWRPDSAGYVPPPESEAEVPPPPVKPTWQRASDMAAARAEQEAPRQEPAPPPADEPLEAIPVEVESESDQPAEGEPIEQPESPEPPPVSKTFTPPPQPAAVSQPWPTADTDQPDDESVASLELRFGQRGLAIVGIGMVLAAITFFLYYLYQHANSDWARVGMVAAVGAVMMGIGHWLSRKKYDTLAMVLLGGGPAAIFAAGMFAWTVYHLIPQSNWPLALAWLAGTAGLTIALSLFYDSRVLATVALVGGFSAPIIVGYHAAFSPHALFTYILLLDVGVLVLGYLKGWRLLNHLLFAGTSVCFVLWAGHSAFNEQLLGHRWLAVGWVSGLFALFYLATLAQLLARPWEPRADAFLLPLRDAAGYVLAVTPLMLMHTSHVRALGLIYFGLAVLYAAAWGLLARSDRPAPGATATAGALAIIAAMVAVPVALRGDWITIGWTVEAVAAMAIGIRLQRPDVRVLNVLLLALAGIHALARYMGTFNDVQSPLNLRAGSALLLAVALFASGWMIRRLLDEENRGDNDKAMSDIYRVLCHLAMLTAFTAETLAWLGKPAMEKQLATNFGQFVLSGGYAVYAIALVVAGFVFRTRVPRVLGLLVFAVAAVKACLFDVIHFSTALRIGAFGILGLMMLTGSFLYYAKGDVLKKELLGIDE